MALDARTADRLAKLCGMLGSDHDGERASAAVLATRELRAAGLDWDGLVKAALRGDGGAADASGTAGGGLHQPLALWCLERVGSLTERDAAFIRSIARRRTVTLRQREWLEDVAAKLGYGRKA